MKSAFKYVAAVAAGFVATAGLAIAGPVLTVPEPGSLALVSVAVVGLVLFARKRNK